MEDCTYVLRIRKGRNWWSREKIEVLRAPKDVGKCDTDVLPKFMFRFAEFVGGDAELAEKLLQERRYVVVETTKVRWYWRKNELGEPVAYIYNPRVVE